MHALVGIQVRRLGKFGQTYIARIRLLPGVCALVNLHVLAPGATIIADVAYVAPFVNIAYRTRSFFGVTRRLFGLVYDRRVVTKRVVKI